MRKQLRPTVLDGRSGSSTYSGSKENLVAALSDSAACAEQPGHVAALPLLRPGDVHTSAAFGRRAALDVRDAKLKLEEKAGGSEEVEKEEKAAAKILEDPFDEAPL